MLFPDEALFTLEDVLNVSIIHVESTENPHATNQDRFQACFYVNV